MTQNFDLNTWDAVWQWACSMREHPGDGDADIAEYIAESVRLRHFFELQHATWSKLRQQYPDDPTASAVASALGALRRAMAAEAEKSTCPAPTEP